MLSNRIDRDANLLTVHRIIQNINSQPVTFNLQFSVYEGIVINVRSGTKDQNHSDNTKLYFNLKRRACHHLLSR